MSSVERTHFDMSVASVGRKLRHFLTPPLFSAPAGGQSPRRSFGEQGGTHKTRMNGLSCGEKIMTICSAVFTEYQRLTGGRTRKMISLFLFSALDEEEIIWFPKYLHFIQFRCWERRDVACAISYKLLKT